MSFQVRFGSQSSVTEDGNTPSGRQTPRGDPHPDSYGGSQRQHNHRGRGRGQGGRRPRRGGGGQFARGTAGDDDRDGSDESDGASSVTSEGQGRQRGRGGRWRGKGDRGRGNRGRNAQKGEHSFEKRRGSYNDLRMPPEETAPSAQQEIHIHYHGLPQSGAPPALPHQHQMSPHVVYPPQQSLGMLGPQPGYPPYPDQPGLHPSLYPLPGPTGNIRQPLPSTSSPMQPYHQAHPQQPYGERHPSQQEFIHSGPPHYSQPGLKQPLLNNPPPCLPRNHGNVGQSSYQQPSQGPSKPPPLLDPHGMAEASKMAGQARGSRQNLSQKPSGQRNERDVRPKQKDEGRKEYHGQKPTKNDHDQQDRKPGTTNKQEQAASSSDSVEIPDLSPDEWIKIFNYLLREFKGRTKLGTLLSRKGDLFKGLSHTQAAAWLKHSTRFLTSEKNGKIKFVSVYFKEARICFKYKKHNTDKCENKQCPFFHICRDFVSGNCPRQGSCHFNHSFHTKSNAKVTAEIGLQAFTDEEIRIIVLRSTPVVCDTFNTGQCNDDCPDLHVCTQFIRNKCSDESCKLGHQIKGTENNDCILEAFHMQRIQEYTLLKMVIVLSEESTQDSSDRKPEGSGTDAANKGAIPRKVPDKTEQRAKDRSKENLLHGTDFSLPSGVQQDSKNPAGKRPRARKPKKPKETNECSDNSPSDMPVADGAEEEMPQQADHYVSDERESLGEQYPTPHRRSRELGATYPVMDSPVDPTCVVATEGREEQRALPASHYTHLCEHHTWTGSCSKSYLCPRYHHRHKPPFIWQMHAERDWHDFSELDSNDIEQHFCALESEGLFEVVLDMLGGMQLSMDFSAMTAKVVASSDRVLVPHQTFKIRRWSTPSYVESEAGVPLSYYSQWIWYHLNDVGDLQPFIPGTLQYTLEEKYHSGQQTYYFEVGKERFLLQLQDMKLVNLSLDISVPVLRRPFCLLQDQEFTAPPMSPVLLSEPPDCHYTGLPSHWGSVDSYQDFEMVELEPSSPECLDVERSFHSTLSRERATILRVFRVQNPSLWDKYCSTKRSMTPRGGSSQDVDERKLFHGTPTLLAARGICANNMDFRHAGENVGAMFGKGSYFSSHSLYSHSYTQGPDRYMFLAKVLVGNFTKGQQSYAFPPIREGLKRYDSCVNDEANPTIFVIFELAQSYPEYLVQYTDAEMGPQGHIEAAQVSATGSGLSGPGARSQGPGPRASARSPVSDIPKPDPPVPRSNMAKSIGETAHAQPITESVKQIRDRFERVTHLDSGTNRADPLHFGQERLQYPNPYTEASGLAGLGRHDPSLSQRGQAVRDSGFSRPQARSAGLSSKKTDSDKCLIS